MHVEYRKACSKVADYDLGASRKVFLWVRPKAMFDEVIERDGRKIRRFDEISEEEALQ